MHNYMYSLTYTYALIPHDLNLTEVIVYCVAIPVFKTLTTCELLKWRKQSDSYCWSRYDPCNAVYPIRVWLVTFEIRRTASQPDDSRDHQGWAQIVVAGVVSTNLKSSKFQVAKGKLTASSAIFRPPSYIQKYRLDTSMSTCICQMFTSGGRETRHIKIYNVPR